jgi:hypothetical protein
MKKCLLAVAMSFAIVSAGAQNNPDTLIPFRLKTKWGYSTTHGKIVIQPQYDTTVLFYRASDGVKFIHCTATIAAKNKKFGLIGTKGETVQPFTYDKIDVSYGYFFLHRGAEKGVADMHGKLIIPMMPSLNIERYGAGYAVYLSENRVNLYNKKGQLVKDGDPSLSVPTRIDAISQDDNNADVIRNVIEPMYDSIATAPGGKKDFIAVKKNGRWGVVSNTGKEITPLKYERIDIGHYLAFKNYYLLVAEKSKWGILDMKTGKLVVPCIYDQVTNQGSYIVIQQGGLKGAADISYLTNDLFIIPARYTDISEPVTSKDFSLFFVKTMTGKTGWVGENGVEFFKD